MYQIFSSLLGHLSFSVQFFLHFYGVTFFGTPNITMSVFCRIYSVYSFCHSSVWLCTDEKMRYSSLLITYTFFSLPPSIFSGSFSDGWEIALKHFKEAWHHYIHRNKENPSTEIISTCSFAKNGNTIVCKRKRKIF